MITAVVGRTFLKAYNQKYGKTLTPKEFFDEIFHPLFFDSTKLLMSITNGPFDQGYKRKRHLTKEGREEDLLNFYDKVESGGSDASIFVGGAASDEKVFRSTSGLVSDIEISVSQDDLILSWIGAGLGVGVGAYSLIFYDDVINMKIFEGWKVYRKYLNDASIKKLSGNKINAWNGQWITYSFGSDFRNDFDFSDLTREGFFKVDKSIITINSIAWSQLFFSLSQTDIHKEQTVYIYDGFVNTNKTIGFIPLYLHSGKKIREVYQKLFGEDYEIDRKDFESLFGIHIKRACELGSIGLTALRPGTLAKYMKNDKTLSFKKSQDTVTYKAYKTWLVAMLSKNKEEIIDYTQEVAKVILDYRNSGSGTGRKNHIEKELFGAFTKKKFIEALIVMIPDLEDKALAAIKNLRNEVHLMTNEEFGYFATLLKFDYTFFEKQQ